MKKISFVSISLLIGAMVTGCGVYTFSGSTLPSYLKTVEIPLFVNQSLQPNIADDITQALTTEIVSTNLLRPVSQNGDAEITGKVVVYNNTPYTFGTSSVREVSVDQYIVRVTVEVDFRDMKKDDSLYKGTVIGEGIYDFRTQTEQDGRTKAIRDAVQKILQNSIQSW